MSSVIIDREETEIAVIPAPKIIAATIEFVLVSWINS